VDDHEIVVDRHLPGEALVRLEVEAFLCLREGYRLSLEGVVEVLRDREEVALAGQDVPLGLDPDVVHERNQREDHLRNAAALVGRVHVEDTLPPERRRLAVDPGDDIVADDGPVVLKRPAVVADAGYSVHVGHRRFPLDDCVETYYDTASACGHYKYIDNIILIIRG